MPKSLRIAIGVHGRFHAFDLARELSKSGHNVTIFTNYPKQVIRRFDIADASLVTFPAHGIFQRIIDKTLSRDVKSKFEPIIHTVFGRFLTRKILPNRYDVTHCFTGVAEEPFTKLKGSNVLLTLVRGSAHILTQHSLLSDEEYRAHDQVDKPSQWMVAREQREYQLANKIVVLSSFAEQSFHTRGIMPSRLARVPLGTSLTKFRASTEAISQRAQRIAAGEPLRVLTVGTFSYRKGALDIVCIAKALAPKIRFTMVGDVAKECRHLASACSNSISFIPRVPQKHLISHYKSHDLFLFPTIEDGYAVVVPQALASGLPIIATSNCCAPDILTQGVNGWIVPIRNPESIIERLQWCDRHRLQYAQIIRNTVLHSIERDWSHVASDFIAVCHREILQRLST